MRKFVSQLLFLSCLIGIVNAQAATKDSYTSSAGFFSQGGAADFSRDLSPTDRKDFEYYLPERKVTLPDEEAEFAAVTTDKAKAAINLEDPSITDPELRALVAQFGNPHEDVPIKAVEDAPSPYKGLLAAIEKGRDDLALQYARQWVMYNKRLDKVTKLAVGMAGVVQEKEGMVPAGTWPSSSKSAISPEALEAYDQSKNNTEGSRTVEINQRAQEILDQVNAMLNEDGKPVAKQAAPSGQSLDVKRTRFLAHLAETYLYVPKGELDVLVFFRPQDKVAQSLGADFEKLYQRLREFPNLQFKAFAPESVTVSNAELFKKASNATFPLVQGERLVNELNLKSFPAIVFVSRQTGEAMIEKEFLEFEFVEQMLRKFGVIS